MPKIIRCPFLILIQIVVVAANFPIPIPRGGQSATCSDCGLNCGCLGERPPIDDFDIFFLEKSGSEWTKRTIQQAVIAVGTELLENKANKYIGILKHDRSK